MSEETTSCGIKYACRAAESGSGLAKVSTCDEKSNLPVKVVEDNMQVEEHAEGAAPQRPLTSSQQVSALGEALVTLELCAGSAMLSAILKRDGFNSIAVDFFW